MSGRTGIRRKVIDVVKNTGMSKKNFSIDEASEKTLSRLLQDPQSCIFLHC